MNATTFPKEVKTMAVRLRLGEILRERGMTQKELADKCEISENGISKMVNQTAQIRLETIDILCEVLGIEPGDLFVREGSSH
jgi:putative transcriptional regulator